MAKKENNRKDHSAREQWMKRKKEGRPKQVWVDTTAALSFDQIDALTLEELSARAALRGWRKVA